MQVFARPSSHKANLFIYTCCLVHLLAKFRVNVYSFVRPAGGWTLARYLRLQPVALCIFFSIIICKVANRMQRWDLFCVFYSLLRHCHTCHINASLMPTAMLQCALTFGCCCCPTDILLFAAVVLLCLLLFSCVALQMKRENSTIKKLKSEMKCCKWYAWSSRKKV